MTYTFALNQRPRTGGEHFWKLKELLVSPVGWTVEGSGDGSSSGGMDGTDRFAPGGSYDESLDVTNAWFVIQDPNGLRQFLFQNENGSNDSLWWLIYYSSDGSGFSGGDATNRPTAADEQIIINAPSSGGVQALPEDNTYISDFIIGDSSENFSFHATVRHYGGDEPRRIDGSLFLDVLDQAHASDNDPAVVGGVRSEDGSSDEYEVLGSTMFDESSSTLKGWYKKGTGEEAWVSYPFTNWRFEDGTGMDEWTDEAGVEELSGKAFVLPCVYSRGAHQTQPGFKGVSHLFRRITNSAGRVRGNADLTRMGFGSVSLPWDGKTAPFF